MMPRKNYLVNRSFQANMVVTVMSFSLWLMLIFTAVALCAIYFYKSYCSTDSGVTLLKTDAYYILPGIVIFSLFLLGTLVLGAILYSHRIAGAAFHIRANLRKLREGQYDLTTTLRTKDFLKDVALELNDLSEALRRREDHHLLLREKVRGLLAAAQPLAASDEALRGKISEVEQLLDPPPA